MKNEEPRATTHNERNKSQITNRKSQIHKSQITNHKFTDSQIHKKSLKLKAYRLKQKPLNQISRMLETDSHEGNVIASAARQSHEATCYHDGTTPGQIASVVPPSQ